MCIRSQGARWLRRAAGAAVLAALCSQAVLASPPLGADVDSLIEHARAANPGFAAEQAEAAAARERVAPAGALPDPSFQLELMDFTNAMNGRSTSLLPGQVGETRYRVIQPLPGWGKRELAERTAAARAEQAGARRDLAWVTLVAEIKAAWLRYYAADRELALNRDALALLQGLEETTLSRYRLGLVPQQAVLRAQREITAQRLALVGVEQRRAGLAAALNGLLAREPRAALAAPADPAPLPASLEFGALLERARAANAGLLADQQGLDVARIERERARLERRPDFSVGLTNNRPRDGENSWDLMFEVMIPLQQGVRDAREREAAHMLTAADARRSATESRIAGELGRAWSTFGSGRETLGLLRGTMIPQAEATRDATRAAFAAGSVDFDSVLEAERQLIDTRLTMLQTEVEARLALAEIEKITGETK